MNLIVVVSQLQTISRHITDAGIITNEEQFMVQVDHVINKLRKAADFLQKVKNDNQTNLFNKEN